MTPTPREALINTAYFAGFTVTKAKQFVDALDAYLDSRGYLVAAPSMGKIDAVAVLDADLARESARHREAAEAVLEERGWNEDADWLRERLRMFTDRLAACSGPDEYAVTLTNETDAILRRFRPLV